MAWNSASRGAVALVLLLPALAGCQAVHDIDAAMRRVDVLDRVFAPEAPSPPPPRVVVRSAPAVRPVPAAAEPEYPKEPEPLPETLEAVAPVPPQQPEAAARVDPGVRRAALIRENPWLTQFWSELDPAEQARVTRAMRRAGRVVGNGAVPPAWDRMGLGERVQLVYGDGA
jgi:hypothetical protein